MIYEHSSYRTFLRSVLAERIQGNPSYSLRAMARQFEILPSQLSQALSGKAGFSVKAARKIGHKLRLDPDEAEYLLLLVQLEGETDPEIRAVLLDRMNRFRKEQIPVRDLTVDIFRQISDWYHCAILELLLIEDFTLTPESAAERLGISTLEAQVAIERLERLELIVRDGEGRYSRQDRDIKFVSPGRSAAMAGFHRQMFEKISTAFDRQQPFTERLNGFETLPVARESLPEINELLEDFFQKVHRIANKQPRRTDVYHLGVHFINLTPKKENV